MKIKQSQKIRVVASQGTVSFYATGKQIREGVGSSQSFNTAVKDALEYMETKQVLGIVGNFNGRSIQLDLV